MDKLKIFEVELGYIKDDEIKEFTKNIILLLPDYFFEVSASSTGKYHPEYALGEGGLVRHTQAAVRIAIELFKIESFKYSEKQKDIIISALILHDGAKLGIPKQKYTITEHPLVISKFIKDNNKILNNEDLWIITECIESHMGQWVYDYKTKKVVLPKPKKDIQSFVHLCDYLASRKCLEFNFNVVVTR